MAIQYKRVKLFVWLNGLVSWCFYPFLKLIDFRKNKTSEVVIIEKSQSISIDMSHYHFKEEAYWKKFKDFKSDALFYAVIPDASIISKGIVVDSQNRVILESTLFQKEYLNNLCSNHLVFLKRFLPKKKDTNVISLLNKLDNNYFHWTLESLTRILLVYEKPFFQDYKILIKTDALPFIEQSLKFLFNISEENIITKHLGENYEVDNAMVISYPHIRSTETHLTNVYIPEIIRKLNTLAHKKLKLTPLETKQMPRNFIISRKHAPVRRILNEEILLESLSEFKFKSVVLENLKYEEQVALFANAERIVCLHGAGITNIIYANKPILIEVFPEGRNIRDAFYFTQITAALGIEHHLFLQKSENKNEDVVIENSTIIKIKNALIKPA